ncbi:MAG TPA: hypothetical protein VMQ62_13210, partial [Dongiaceae bacterium]|nr:hypothetical protein [Dongiaceae bacterium]
MPRRAAARTPHLPRGSDHRRPDRRRGPALAWAGLLAGGLLVAAPSPGFAAGSGAPGAIRLVPFEGAPEGAGIIPTADLEQSLEVALREKCDPDRIAETLAAPYRALGYVPRVDVSCSGAGADVRIRESSHRIALLTFDPADLKALNLIAQG